MRRTLLSLAASAAVLTMLPSPALAIPAFARAYEYSCNTCHAPFPKLTEFGEEFAGNAFAPSDAEMPPRYFRDVGDDDLSLLKILPLAVRTDIYADVRLPDDDKGDGYNDFKAPYGLKLLSGGRIAEDIGYYFYFFLSERGEVAGVEDAYVHFNDLFGSPVDLMVGQFQVSDPLFKRELRLSFQDYLPYRLKPGRSHTDLRYDRGLLFTAGFDMGLDVALIVANGNGKNEADVRRDFDLDRYKHGMVRLSQSLGPVRLGVFGYYGREQEEVGAVRRNNYVAWAGPDLTVATERVELNAQYLYRRDANPTFMPATQWQQVESHAVIGEVVARLMGDPGELYAVLLFNWIDSDADEADQEAYTATLTYLLRTNIRVMAEYTHARILDGREAGENRAVIGLVGGW